MEGWPTRSTTAGLALTVKEILKLQVGHQRAFSAITKTCSERRASASDAAEFVSYVGHAEVATAGGTFAWRGRSGQAGRQALALLRPMERQLPKRRARCRTGIRSRRVCAGQKPTRRRAGERESGQDRRFWSHRQQHRIIYTFPSSSRCGICSGFTSSTLESRWGPRSTRMHQ